MRSSKWKLAALALVAALVLSGCGMVTVDKDAEAKEPVVVVNGETVTRAEAQPIYQYYYYMYSQYGVDTSSLKDDLINSYIEDKLLLQKAKELSLNTLTDEEKAEVDKSANEQLENDITQYKSKAATSTMTEDEARQATIKYLSDNGETLESITTQMTESKIKEKVKNYVEKDVTVTDDEVQAKYKELVASDTTNYATAGYTFESAVTQGKTIAFYPEGYRTVKHILLKYSDEQSTKLSGLNTELSDVETQISDLTKKLATPDPSATPTIAPAPTPTLDPSASPEPAATPEPTMEELEAKKADVEQRLAAYKQELLASFQTKIDEIKQKLTAGTSFEDLIAEYGEDPGMKQEPTMSMGYYVAANSAMWDPAFTAGAMALQKVGDVSEPIVGTSGIHVIKYMTDVTPGEVPLEQIAEKVKAETLTAKQGEAYKAQLEDWKSKANIQKYPQNLSETSGTK